MFEEQVIKLGIKAANLFMTNTVDTIYKKVEAAKDDSNKEKTINRLEDLINELIDERIELNKIMKEYEELIGMQKISKEDINYIVENILPVVSNFFDNDLVSSNEEIHKDEIDQLINMLAPLLSIETFTILQLLGFNFKEAVGIPLTKLVKRSIDKENLEDIKYKYLISNNKKDAELFKLLQTEEGRVIFDELLKSKSIEY